MSRFYQSSLLNFGNANVGGSLAAGQSAGLSLARMKEEQRRHQEQQRKEKSLADLMAASYEPQTGSVNPTRLMDLAATSATEHLPTAQAYSEQMQKRQAEQQKRINEELWAAFGGAKSEADMEAGKAYLLQRGAPEGVIKSIPPYSPQAIDRLARMALGPKEYTDYQKTSKASTSTPYYQFLQSADGFYAGNSRTGQVAPVIYGGKSVIGSASDPGLQGRISEAKEEGKAVGEQRGMIGGKYQAVDSVRDAKKLINDGIYAGYYGEIKKTLAKAIPLVDKRKAANTERFVSHVGNIVIPRLKEFGGNDSNEEMRYLQRVMAGDITMEPEALMKILDDAEKKIQQGIERLNRGDPGAPGVQEGTTRRNRRTGEVQVFMGGQWQRQ